MNAKFDCIYCGSSDYKIVYDYEIRHIVKCLSCGLMALFPRPRHDELAQIYTKDYYSNEHLVGNDLTRIYGYYDYLAERVNKQKNYETLCEKIKSYIQPSGAGSPRLLDLGAGLGFFLESAEKSGFSVEGSEYSEYARSYIKEQFGYKVTKIEEPDDIKQINGPFDVVTMHDLIEHFDDPLRYLKEISDLQEPGGVLYLSTMDSESIVSRIFGKRLEDFRRIQEHLFFFSRQTIRMFLEAAGYEVIRIQSVGHSFELGMLLSRMRNIVPLVVRPIQIVVRQLDLEKKSVYLNPFTKMAVFARRSG